MEEFNQKMYLSEDKWIERKNAQELILYKKDGEGDQGKGIILNFNDLLKIKNFIDLLQENLAK